MNRAALTFLQGSKHFSFILRKCLDLLLLQCLCCGLMPSFFTPNFLIKIFMNLLCQKLQETFRRKCLFSWKCSLTSHLLFGPESPAVPRLNGFYIYMRIYDTFGQKNINKTDLTHKLSLKQHNWIRFQLKNHASCDNITLDKSTVISWSGHKGHSPSCSLCHYQSLRSYDKYIRHTKSNAHKVISITINESSFHFLRDELFWLWKTSFCCTYCSYCIVREIVHSKSVATIYRE